MIPVIIRRHSLQDLTLGQSVMLTVPSCEECQEEHLDQESGNSE